MEIIQNDKNMESVYFAFKNSSSSDLEPKLKFNKSKSNDEEFVMTALEKRSGYNNDTKIVLGKVTLKEMEDIVSILKIMQCNNNKEELITETI